ncbi:5-(carboxyamino)imidazole ribonucleotide synthase [Nitrosococcus wardiae]|uniref:N5-carboxyaminoimidazole ribonucleotide synthase n=1 Tax=Nitrosococcus wardiae TaxID=1814290 RepID=A0A4P7C0Y8_9GAMM|nr:5-(carboxyamino)imidazole ribonucleotide synthase [Nitrosococcus wardiae]QBQ55247.1 5-(carboxyamino)imidazole ribonucleotide synthase [Nitrosococcus wardiae]
MKVGIMGGGQLARMLALAGHRLGVHCLALDPQPDACAAPVAQHIIAAYDDRNALTRLSQASDCVTFEFENVPHGSLQFVAAQAAVYPPLSALAAAQDRLHEKNLFRALGIPTPPFIAVDNCASLAQAVAEIGLPAVLKRRTQGYDGKGQIVLRAASEIEAAWLRLGAVPMIVERFVPFERELSLVVVRGRDLETAFYPLTENLHHDGILRVSWSRPGDALQEFAEDYVRRLLDELKYVGVMAVEFFQVSGGLLANEFAPRVHNSGHWTIEGAETCQFENHMRAILGLPLGSTASVGCAAMVNFIGTLPEIGQVLAIPQTHLHIYGKEAYPGRKLGHVTLWTHDRRALPTRLNQLRALKGGDRARAFRALIS